MKSTLAAVLLVAISILLVAGPARAQDRQGMSGESLKERIELLEKTDVKSKSPTVQLIYKRSLLRLYNDYTSILEQEIADLKNIQVAVGDGVPAAKSEAAARVLQLTGELNVTSEKIRTLTGDLQAAVSSGATSGETTAAGAPVSAGPAQYERVSYPKTGVPGASTYTGSLNLSTTGASYDNSQNPAPLAGMLRTGADTPPAATPPTAGTQPPAENNMEVDWRTRTAGCPPKVTQSSTRVTVHVTNVNNLLVDFDRGSRLEYRLRAKGTPVSAVPPSGIFIGQAGAFTVKSCATDLDALLGQVKNDVRGNPNISPQSPIGHIDWQTTLDAAMRIDSVKCVINVLAQRASDDPIFNNLTNSDVLSWVKLLRGNENSHSFDFTVVLEPDENYEFTLTEVWKGATTGGGTLRWNCGEKDIFTLSVGPLVSTLPSRTYNHQKAPVPPGSTTTQDILTVGNKSNINVLGAALINYHFPQPSFLPRRAGLALSVGPVYTLGSTPNVSALGLFVGTSFNLSRSVFLTPGVHIGQFADFPEGFGPGSVIPNQFGDLNPVKRMTAKFAIGITFKTNSFKKASEGNGSASNTSAGGNSGTNQQGSGNQSTSGSHGTGSNTPGGGTPQPTPKPFDR